jgi:adenylate cyclase
MGFNRMAHGLRERERLRTLFGHHVGPDVARRAMEAEVALGGEVVEATAMFVDMIASSTLAEQRPPDEVVEILNAYFDAVVRCVGAEGGYVSKFEGDGAMCIFGAPIAHPDHAARALRAAAPFTQSCDRSRSESTPQSGSRPDRWSPGTSARPIATSTR